MKTKPLRTIYAQGLIKMGYRLSHLGRSHQRFTNTNRPDHHVWVGTHGSIRMGTNFRDARPLQDEVAQVVRLASMGLPQLVGQMAEQIGRQIGGKRCPDREK